MDDIDPGTVVLTALAELRGIPDDRWIEGPVFDRVVRLDRAMALIRGLKDAIASIELSLIDSMDEDELAFPGVGKLVRGEKLTTKWQDKNSGERMREDLAVAVASQVALDVATGEMDPMKRNVALAAIRTAYEAIPSFNNLKVSGRKRLGLRMDDYLAYESHYVVTLETMEEEG